MPSLRLALLLAFVVSAGILPAQGRTGRVRGVVVDSLLGDILPGAEVRIDQLARRATTDSSGRFVLDSVPPGEWTVVFRHPSLDSLGIVVEGTRVRVFAGASAAVMLATPSFESIRPRFCAETPDSLSPTVAFGSVESGDGSRVRVSVSVSWLLTDAQGNAVQPGTVRTVPEGNRQVWVACGIPPATWFHASVQDSTRSASALVKMNPRGLAVRDLVLSSGVATLTGTVTDADGRPVRDARVSITGSGLAAESDASGTFRIPEAPNGTITLDVRAAGFRPWVAPLRIEAAPVAVRLQLLGDPEPRGALRGSDYLRLLQRSTRDGLQLVTQEELASDTAALVTLPPAGTCGWWLDGRPVEREFFIAQPQWSWRALEMYPRGADAPPEYRTAKCAVVLLWTAASDW